MTASSTLNTQFIRLNEQVSRFVGMIRTAAV
jgi:hypothetical protein